MEHVAGWMIAAWVTAAAPAAAAPIPPAKPAPAAAHDVEIRTSLDRTAVWVADPVAFTIEITCAPGIDVLDDDLSRDKLKLDGLEVTGTETTRDPGPGQTTIRRFRYGLTTYHVDQRALRIGGISVRYYRTRAGERPENMTPAGEAQVPGAVLAFRSMLPDDQDTYPLRDGRPAAARPRLTAAAQPIGIALVVASIVPVLVWAAAFARTRRPRKERRSIRQVQQEERSSLEAVRAIDLGAPDGRLEAYTTINTLVRDHLREVCGVPGQSLTPGEVQPALAGRSTRVPAETAAALLAACETARYAPPDALPSADACRTAIDQAAEVLAAR